MRRWTPLRCSSAAAGGGSGRARPAARTPWFPFASRCATSTRAAPSPSRTTSARFAPGATGPARTPRTTFDAAPSAAAAAFGCDPRRAAARPGVPRLTPAPAGHSPPAGAGIRAADSDGVRSLPRVGPRGEQTVPRLQRPRHCGRQGGCGGGRGAGDGGRSRDRAWRCRAGGAETM